MIGYGPEDTHFVIELTYNYGIKEYQTGNDFKAITIHSKDVIEKARANNWPIHEENGKFVVQAPGGYKYCIINEQLPINSGKYKISQSIFNNIDATITLKLKLYNIYKSVYNIIVIIIYRIKSYKMVMKKKTIIISHFYKHYFFKYIGYFE